MILCKIVVNFYLILALFGGVCKSTQLYQYSSDQDLVLEDEPSSTETPGLPRVEFIVDSEKDNKHPWSYSSPSADPELVHYHWFSYFENWHQADTRHLTDYFEDHSINIELLKSTTSNRGFWTSFTNNLCYPGTFPPTTTTVPDESDPETSTASPIPPEPHCPDYYDEKPFFKIEFEDPTRYVLQTLSITYAKSKDSTIDISLLVHLRKNQTFIEVIACNNSTITENSENAYLFEDGVPEMPEWKRYSYNLPPGLDYGCIDENALSNVTKVEIKIELVTSDEFDSGEFVIIDKIELFALDQKPTEPPEITSPSPSTEFEDDTTENNENPTSSRLSSTPTPEENSSVSLILLPSLLMSAVLSLYIMF